MKRPTMACLFVTLFVASVAMQHTPLVTIKNPSDNETFVFRAGDILELKKVNKEPYVMRVLRWGEIENKEGEQLTVEMLSPIFKNRIVAYDRKYLTEQLHNFSNETATRTKKLLNDKRQIIKNHTLKPRKNCHGKYTTGDRKDDDYLKLNGCVVAVEEGFKVSGDLNRQKKFHETTRRAGSGPSWARPREAKKRGEIIPGKMIVSEENMRKKDFVVGDKIIITDWAREFESIGSRRNKDRQDNNTLIYGAADGSRWFAYTTGRRNYYGKEGTLRFYYPEKKIWLVEPDEMPNYLDDVEHTGVGLLKLVVISGNQFRSKQGKKTSPLAPSASARLQERLTGIDLLKTVENANHEYQVGEIVMAHKFTGGKRSEKTFKGRLKEKCPITKITDVRHGDTKIVPGWNVEFRHGVEHIPETCISKLQKGDRIVRLLPHIIRRDIAGKVASMTLVHPILDEESHRMWKVKMKWKDQTDETFIKLREDSILEVSSKTRKKKKTRKGRAQPQRN